MADWHVLLDGADHIYTSDEAPEKGTTMYLGNVLAKVEDITQGADEQPVAIAQRAFACELCGNTSTKPLDHGWKTRVPDAPEQGPWFVCPNHTDEEIERLEA